MEEAIALGVMDLSIADTWPKVMASAGYRSRDTDLLTNMRNVDDPGNLIQGRTISSERNAGTADLEPAKSLGIDRIELYTGPYAEAFAAGDADEALARCRHTAQLAQALGIGVNAGHDLSQANLAALLAGVPDVLEVSIGHALIGEALYDGLATTVRDYLTICRGV